MIRNGLIRTNVTDEGLPRLVAYRVAGEGWHVRVTQASEVEN